jgi:hypothetical protein
MTVHFNPVFTLIPSVVDPIIIFTTPFSFAPSDLFVPVIESSIFRRQSRHILPSSRLTRQQHDRLVRRHYKSCTW